MRDLKLYSILTPLMLVIDFVWIGLVMKGFYGEQLGDLARRSGGGLAPRWIPAILVYILIPAGLVFFVQPRLGSGPWWADFLWGALFGMLLYGVYDLTNLATLEQWKFPMTVVDIVWGSFLCGAMSIVLTLIKSRIA